MRNIQNRHKRIKHRNSLIIARLWRKLIKFSENPVSGSEVSGLRSEPWDGSWISRLESEQKSRVSGLTLRIFKSHITSLVETWVLNTPSEIKLIDYVIALVTCFLRKVLSWITHKSSSWSNDALYCCFLLLRVP